MLMDQHLLGEGGEVGELLNRSFRLVEPGGLVPPAARFTPVADRHMTRQAGLAMAAEGGEAGDDMIARFHVIDVRADLLHHASRFVPQHDRQTEGIEPLHKMEIAMADTRGGRSHQNLARSRLVDFHILDHQWLAHLVQHGGFHHVSPML